MNNRFTALAAVTALLLTGCTYTEKGSAADEGCVPVEICSRVPVSESLKEKAQEIVGCTSEVSLYSQQAAVTYININEEETAVPATEAPVTEAPTTEPITEPPAEEMTAAEEAPEVSGTGIISVANILQYPELPTGCEVTSLAMLLGYFGYPVDKLTLSREYLPKMDFFTEDGILYGADYTYTFAGDPESEYGYGCGASCIANTANSYLAYMGAGCSAYDISGTDLDTLLGSYISYGIPVMIWITSGCLHSVEYTDIWTTPEGYTVQWKAYEHCVVMTGYDSENQQVYVSDPLYSDTSYDLSLLRQRYDEMGRQAVVIQ